MPVVFYQPQGILGRLRTLTHSTTKKNFSQTLILAPTLGRFFFVLAKREALKQKISGQNLPSGGRKLVVLSRSVFRTHETDRTSLSCIVMQRPENDSDAFFWFGLCFLVFLRFLRQKATEGVLHGTYNGSYGKWIGFAGRLDRFCRWG